MSKITEKAHFPHGPIVKSRNFYSSEKKGILFYVLSVILYLLHNYTGIVWITIGDILYQSNKQKK